MSACHDEVLPQKTAAIAAAARSCGACPADSIRIEYASRETAPHRGCPLVRESQNNHARELNISMQHNQRPEQENAQDALAFHAQLRSLIEANVPVCIDDCGGHASLASIESLQTRLQSHIDSHGTIDATLSDDSLPLGYRIAMREWLDGAKQGSLERLTAGTEGQRFYRNAVSFIFLQASLILGAVLVGMVCMHFLWQ